MNINKKQLRSSLSFNIEEGNLDMSDILKLDPWREMKEIESSELGVFSNVLSNFREIICVEKSIKPPEKRILNSHAKDEKSSLITNISTRSSKNSSKDVVTDHLKSNEKTKTRKRKISSVNIISTESKKNTSQEILTDCLKSIENAQGTNTNSSIKNSNVKQKNIYPNETNSEQFNCNDESLELINLERTSKKMKKKLVSFKKTGETSNKKIGVSNTRKKQSTKLEKQKNNLKEIMTDEEIKSPKKPLTVTQFRKSAKISNKKKFPIIKLKFSTKKNDSNVLPIDDLQANIYNKRQIQKYKQSAESEKMNIQVTGKKKVYYNKCCNSVTNLSNINSIDILHNDINDEICHSKKLESDISIVYEKIIDRTINNFKNEFIPLQKKVINKKVDDLSFNLENLCVTEKNDNAPKQSIIIPSNITESEMNMCENQTDTQKNILCEKNLSNDKISNNQENILNKEEFNNVINITRMMRKNNKTTKIQRSEKQILDLQCHQNLNCNNKINKLIHREEKKMIKAVHKFSTHVCKIIKQMNSNNDNSVDTSNYSISSDSSISSCSTCSSNHSYLESSTSYYSSYSSESDSYNSSICTIYSGRNNIDDQ